MIAALACLLLAIPTHLHEGDAQAFASLTDAKGRPLADSRYSQWIEGGLLHLQTRSDFPGGRTVVEHATLRLHPQLEQESWEWSEKNGDRLVRTYQVDFKTGKAVATRVDQGKHWKEDLGIEPGKTFAGIGFLAAIEALRAQLAVGQHFELQAVAMTPKPRVATVTVTRDGPSRYAWPAAPSMEIATPSTRRSRRSRGCSSPRPICTSGWWTATPRRSCASRGRWSSPAIPSSAST